MSTPRLKFQLILEILNTVEKGINKPTRITNNLNISWKTGNTVLKEMLSFNLINCNYYNANNNKYKFYNVTERGKMLISTFRDNNELFFLLSLN